MKSNRTAHYLLFVTFIGIPYFFNVTVYSQTLKRAFTIGSSGTDLGTAVANDSSGNIIVTGTFDGADADADPGIGTSNLQAFGGSDIYLAKYSSTGELQWAFSIGGTADDAGKAIAIDASGNIYLTGYVGNAQVDYDPSSNEVTYTPYGGKDVFLAKYSPSGAHLWSVQMGGALDEEGSAMTFDRYKDVYVTGYMTGSNVDFNPDGSSGLLKSHGSKDIFLVKYTSTGLFEWADNMGGSGNDEGNGVGYFDNNLFVCGYFSGQADFGGSSITSYGNSDAFFAKYYYYDGSFKWVMGFGGTKVTKCNAMIVTALGHIYITGSFSGLNADFDPYGGTQKFNTNGLNDIFLARYGYDGLYTKAVTMGGSLDDEGKGICIDKNGNLYVTGSFSSTNIDFDPGSATHNLGAITKDCFIAKYSSLFDYKWAYTLGTELQSEGKGISVDKNLMVTTTGYFTGEADFSPQSDSVFLQSNGASADAFVTTVTGNTVSVREYNEEPLIVYPNPCMSNLYFKNIPSGHQMLVHIYNAIGRLVSEAIVSEGQLSVQDIPAGVYTAIIYHGPAEYIFRFVKL